MTTEADRNYIDTYARCKKCGWVHFVDTKYPDAPWRCFMCRNVGKEAFDLVKGSELTEKERHLGAITTPVNNIPCSPVTDMIMKLFKLWQLSTEDCMSLWGIAQESHKGKNREEAAVILIDEVRSLLYIHKSLRILFPKNREIVYSWPTTLNQNFDGLSPVEFIKRDGVAGLDRVRDYLMTEIEK